MSDYVAGLVDPDALAAYLAAELGPADRFAVERHPAGHSNETLFVTWGERELVVRRPPTGETAETAHDVLREFRVLDALQGGDVRVPRTVLACEDNDVMGADFYVMERLAGDVIRDVEPERFGTPVHRERVGTELVDALAEIHAVDYEAVGLGEFGRPAGYTERQVERWHRQFDWAFEVTAAEREVPEIARLGEWLDAHVPDGHDETLVHGDYKLDNVLFAPGTPPDLAGVFDWELSTLGDPLADVGWLLLFWHEAGDPDPPMPDLMPTLTAREGYPTRDDLVARYEARTGRAFAHERFYRVLAAYKMAALGEMFFRRHLEGNADDPLYPPMRERVPALAERAVAYLDGESAL
ncbi:MAG: phosphotransferase family protein [Halobacteriaceae archaeon]